MKIALCGSSGRMGQIVMKVAMELGHGIVAEINGSTELANCLSEMPDVCIDFSSPAGAVRLCRFAADMKIPTLVGTTGLNGEDRVCIRECARSIPILLASNFSIGIHVIRRLLREAARALPDTFDVEIVEKHHRKKKDAPSGTALDMLADIGESGRNISATFGRHGRNERASGEVCIHSLRGGDVCGEHSVYFFGNGESIEIVHRAESREIFARGVLMAAEKFRGEKRPGLYGLSDVI